MKKAFFLFLILVLNSCVCMANLFNKDSILKDAPKGVDTSVYIASKSEALYKKHELEDINSKELSEFLRFACAYYILSGEYEFKTSIYSDDENNIYLKLSGDALLSHENLVELFNDLKTKFDTSKIKNIYIDDSIIKADEFTDINVKQITPYTIDKNIVKISLNRSSLATNADIVQNDDYKIPVINELKIGKTTNYTITRDNEQNIPLIHFKGTISKDETVTLPVLNPEINFKIKLYKAIEKNKIMYFNGISSKKIPSNAKLICSIVHNMKDISQDVIVNADYYTADLTTYTAAAKFVNYSHSADSSDIDNMFEKVNNDFNLKYKTDKTTNNLIVNAKYCSEFIENVFKNTSFWDVLLRANQGVITDRFNFLNDFIRVFASYKGDYCIILGKLITKKQNETIFSIITKSKQIQKSSVKNMENSILTTLYRNY